MRLPVLPPIGLSVEEGLSLAVDLLRSVDIDCEKGGAFGFENGSPARGVIIIARDSDLEKAIAELKRCGFHAVVG